MAITALLAGYDIISTLCHADGRGDELAELVKSGGTVGGDGAELCFVIQWAIVLRALAKLGVPIQRTRYRG